MNFQPLWPVALLSTAIFLSGCESSSTAVSNSSPAEAKAIVLVSVTSDVEQAPQSVDMAMKLAGFALDENRHVAMFFNVQGVHIPTSDLDENLAFGDNDPIKKQLQTLIDRGAQVHVCPICMKALGVEEADIVEGAQVTTRPKLFANIGGDTAVFTY